MTELRKLLEGPYGTVAVALFIALMALLWWLYVRFHKGAAPEQTEAEPASEAVADASGSTGSTAAGGQADTAIDVLTRVDPPTYNQTHDEIAAYVSDRSVFRRSHITPRLGVDESSRVFWFLVAPLIAATAAAVLFAVYSDPLINTLRGVVIGAALLAVAILIAGRQQAWVPTLWWVVVVAVGFAAAMWSCYLLTHGLYGREVVLLRERASGHSLSDSLRIMLHRFGSEAALGLTMKALGAAVVAALGCYLTFRLFGVLAAVEAVKRTDPGQWHQDLVEKLYPKGGPRNAAIVVLIAAILGLGLSSGRVAHWFYAQAHHKDSSDSGSADGSGRPSAHDITGTARNDVLTLTARPDHVLAKGGNDRIIVKPDHRADVINCGPGRDTVVFVGRRESADRVVSCEQLRHG